MLPVLMNAAQIDAKFDRFDRPSTLSFAGEELIPQGSQDDVPTTVRLAVETGAILVTADAPLREHLAASGIQERYSLRVLTPEEALESL